MLTIHDTIRCDDNQIIVIINIKQPDKCSNLFMSLKSNDPACTTPRQAVILNPASLAKAIVSNGKQRGIETLGGHH